MKECVQNSLKYDSVVSERATTSSTAALEPRPVSLTDGVFEEVKQQDDLTDSASTAMESKRIDHVNRKGLTDRQTD